MEHHEDRRIMDELEDIRVIIHNIKSLDVEVPPQEEGPWDQRIPKVEKLEYCNTI